jgi:predicted methyltransferase
MRKLLLPLLVAATFSSPALIAADFSESIKQAMTSDVRTDRESKRDRNRKPVQTLNFFGIEDDMKVLEIVPGGGWYTKLLAPALRDNGQFYLSLGTERLKTSLLTKKPFDKVKLVGSEGFDFENLNFEVTDLDAVLTFRNYHNFGDAERTSVNNAAFKALKPGGIYGVVDHTRRHM